MATYDERIAALEKDSAIMKHDIIYKLDDTNSAVTIIKGIVGSQEKDVQYLINQMKSVNVHLEGIDLQLLGLKEEIRAIKRQQETQGQDIIEIKRSVQALEEKFEQRFTSLEGKFEQVLQLLTTLTNRLE